MALVGGVSVPNPMSQAIDSMGESISAQECTGWVGKDKVLGELSCGDGRGARAASRYTAALGRERPEAAFGAGEW